MRGAQPDFHRKPPAVFADPLKVSSGAHRPRLRTARIVRDMAPVRTDVLLGQQNFDRLTQELFHAVAEHVCERLIHIPDIAPIADHHDTGGSGL